MYSEALCTETCLVLFDRCQEVGSEERRKERREEKCPFLENSGSEEDVLQILQYMATILGKYMKCVNACMSFSAYECPSLLLLFVHVCVDTHMKSSSRG